MNIILLGDIAFNGLISEQPEKNTERFSLVAPILQDADLVFANLETPVKAGTEYNNEKSIIHYASYEVAKDLLTKLNIGCVSLANNHIYDCKMDGLKATINLLDKIGICHTGAGWKQEHIEPVIIERGGQRIGFLAYVEKSTDPKTENFPELLINYYSIEKVISDVTKLNGKVDKVICSIHWGVDYSFYPRKQQREDARELIDNGVDIVMGHHPHTIQPYEKKNKEKYIFYSLGGFCYGDSMWKGYLRSLKKRTKNSFIVKTSNYKDYEFIPIKELKGNFLTFRTADFIQWSNRKWFMLKIIDNCKIVFIMVTLHNRYWVKFYDYFWGYYRTPLIAVKELINKLL